MSAGLFVRHQFAAIVSASAVLFANAAIAGTTAGLIDDPFADRVISYTPGAGVSAGFDDPASALGSPTRVTAPDSPFGGPVTPFQGSFGAGETVSIGEGGQLTVAFDTAVTNDALNPFGIDLLIFGNQFLFGDSLFSEGGLIELSADGVTFIEVPNVFAEDGFPTLGFTDVNKPFNDSDGPVTGSIPTDFTKPVDPTFNPLGASLADILAAYDGSGGGLGIDIGALGLDEVSFVRISSPIGSGFGPEIDAFADVRAIPSPAAGSLLAFAAFAASRRRRN
ncbi:MAG: hypothetical protein AAF297_12285 [Planctomycetota bacterium]